MPKVPTRRRLKHKKDHKKWKRKQAQGQSLGETHSTAADVSEPFSRPASAASSAAESVNLDFDDETEASSSNPQLTSPTVASVDNQLVSPSPGYGSSCSCSTDDHTTPSPSPTFKVPKDTFIRSTSPQEAPQPEPLKEVKLKVEMFLNENCVSHIHNNCVYIMYLSRSDDKVTQRQLCFRCDGSVAVKVHCKPYDIQNQLKTFLVPKNLNSNTVGHFVDRMVQILNFVLQFEVCAGVSDLEYKDVWSSCDSGEIDKNPYGECRYRETFRSLKCHRLVAPRKWKCSECCKLLGPLKRKFAMSQKEELHRMTPNVHMTEKQKLKKLEDQRTAIQSTKRQVERLKIQQLIKEGGVNVDENLSTYFHNVLKSQNLSPSQSLFLQQQLMAIQAKGPTGRRWHPAMIRFALSIITKSPSAYGALLQGGLLSMPCARTLFDYAHFKPTEVGIDYAILHALSERVESMTESGENYKQFHVLMCDEMYISKNLVYNSSGKIMGYVNIGDVDLELKALQEYLENPEAKNDTTPSMASKVLTYLIKGTASSVKEAVASYPVDILTKEQLYRWTWEVITKLERAGISVIAFTSDGSPINRAFIKMNKPATLHSEVVFDTINKAAPERCLYFIADVPHLLKTIRNCFYSSSDRRYLNKRTDKMMLRRRLEKNGQKILWSTIINLYNHQKEKTIRLAYKLNVQNVFLNSYSKMKVKYAAQVLSRTVAQYLESLKWENTSETVEFIRKVNDFFDMLNGAHSTQGARTLNANLSPYTTEDDSRFAELENFLSYLKEWKAEAEATTGENTTVRQSMIVEADDPADDIAEEEDFDENTDPASVRQLSRQTLEGIDMTIRGFTGAVRFLLKEGTKFINARVFCQDPLEQFFSKLRSRGGGSTNPNFSQVLLSQRSIHLQGQLASKRHHSGNTETLAETMDLSNERLPKRQSATRAAASKEQSNAQL